jgi:transposase
MAEAKKGHRRAWSIEDKRRIVGAADAAKYGELAPLLKREGTYSSQLAAWRRELGPARTAGAKASAANILVPVPKLSRATKPPPVAKAEGGLERQIAGWRRKIELAEGVLEARNKLRDLEAELERPDGR